MVQTELSNGDTQANTRRGCEIISQAADMGADIVCLPELFNTGYELTARQLISLAQPSDGPHVQTLCALARERGVYIISGYAESCHIPSRVYNSAAFISDKGEVIGNMRKVYLWGKEKQKFRAGGRFPVYDTPIGKIGILVCYDCEFPEPARILALKGAELVFVPALWSKAGARRWDLDLAGNALFNQMFMAGANPVGENLCGTSQVYGPDGELVAAASKTEEELLLCDIDLDQIPEARAKIPYFNDFREDTFSMDALQSY